MSDSSSKTEQWKQQTLAVRAGQHRSNEQEHNEPIFTTSSFVFDSAEQAAARFANQEPGNVYSRFTNPSVSLFERRLAAMEQGEACVATASGMSAILTLCLTSLKPGEHVLCSSSVFGATRLLFSNTLKTLGIESSFVSLTDLDGWRAGLTSKTKMVFFETPANPLTEVGDIQAISDIAHRFNPDIRVVVDNCFCTPVLQQPIRFGADVVVHSATKFIDGQGRCVGGAIVGDAEYVVGQVQAFMRAAGPCLSPFNAWVFAKGLETLFIRMKHSCQTALSVAQWLHEQDFVETVFYPGLPSHPQYQLAQTQQNDSGAIVSFVVKGGQAAAWKLINQTQMLSITGNLGDAKTTITHPATTTHARWSDEMKAQSGIVGGLLRLSIGLESGEDIIDDINV